MKVWGKDGHCYFLRDRTWCIFSTENVINQFNLRPELSISSQRLLQIGDSGCWQACSTCDKVESDCWEVRISVRGRCDSTCVMAHGLYLRDNASAFTFCFPFQKSISKSYSCSTSARRQPESPICNSRWDDIDNSGLKLNWLMTFSVENIHQVLSRRK